MDPVLDLCLRLALSALLLWAASHKLRDPVRFGATVRDYRLVPPALVAAAAATVVVAEVSIGVALAVGAARSVALAAAAGLFSLYGAAIGANLLRGRRHVDCGCLGPAGQQPLSGWLVGRNAALVVAALAGLGRVAPRPLVWLDGVTIAAGLLVLAAAWGAASHLIAQAPLVARLRS